MMKKTAGVVLLIAICFTAFSQDAIIRKLQSESLRSVKKDMNDTTWKTWKLGGTYAINVGQGTLSNWAAGGDDFSLTIASSLSLYGFYKKNHHYWDNTMDLNFGYVNTTSLGSRKNDDRFDILSKYGYALTSKLNAAALVNLRSQFLKGYTYQENTRKFASDFLSPAYVITSLGLDYKPTNELSIFASPVTSRWVFVKDDSLSARGEYGVKPGTHSLNQLGSFATISYQKPFNKYVTYKGRLDIFSNYKDDPLNADFYLTNVLSAKIARIIAFSWNLDMFYDDDVELFGKNKSSPALQIKSIIGVGLQVKI
jgi:hypothetical protein